MVNVFNKDNATETVRTCCRYIKDHLQYANVNLSFQMHKFHHWPEFNNSSVFKCLDNGHCDCTSLQFKTSTIHHWTAFATKTTWIKECVLMLAGPCAIVSDGE